MATAIKGIQMYVAVYLFSAFFGIIAHIAIPYRISAVYKFTSSATNRK